MIVMWALDFASAAVGLALLMCVWRLLRGPQTPDRVMALDTMYINVVALIVLMGIRQGSSVYFEAALLVALLGFASTVALARYLTRGDIID